MSDPISRVKLDFGKDNNFSNSNVSIGDLAGRDINKIYAAPFVPPIPLVSQPVADFIGREQERRDLGAVLLTGGRVVIRGIGGLGKTQLALRLAADVAADFPDGQLLIALRGSSPERLTAVPALHSVLWTLRGSTERLPDDEPSLVALYRATLGDKRLLVVVDDAPDSATAQMFVPPTWCALVVTSRQRITLDGYTSLDLAHLSPTQSRELLLQLAPRLEADPNTPDLLLRCANLPLALRIVGAVLRERDDLSTDRYLERLNDERRRMTALAHDNRDVYAILGTSDTLLAERDSTLADRWRMLHVCPAPFERAVIAALWDEQNDDTLDDALGELLRRSLLHYDSAAGRYSLHDLLRDIARQRCPADLALAAYKRHARYYCDLANEADNLYQQGGDDVLRGLALFDANEAHIVAGQAWAAGHAGAEDLRIHYALRSPSVLALRLHPRTRIIWLEAARTLAESLGDQYSEAITIGALGNAYGYLGEVETAIGYFDRCLTMMRTIGNQRGERGEGICLGNLGRAYEELGDIETAISYHEQQLVIARASGDPPEEARALGGLGNSYRNWGEVNIVMSYYQQQLVMVRAIGEPRGESHALVGLGLSHADLGDSKSAISCYEQSLEISWAIKDQQGEATACWHLGMLLETQGMYQQAAVLIQVCVDYLRELGHPDAEKYAAYLEQVWAKARREK